MTRWWDYLAAVLFAYFIFVNAFNAAVLVLTGSVWFFIPAAAAYFVYNWWEDLYIPFRIKYEQDSDTSSY